MTSIPPAPLTARAKRVMSLLSRPMTTRFAAFFTRLAHDGINSSNTLFVFTADENDHFAGGTPEQCLRWRKHSMHLQPCHLPKSYHRCLSIRQCW